MSEIQLTDTVRCFLSTQTATALEQLFAAVTGTLAISGRPVTDWLLDAEQGEIHSLLLFTPPNQEDEGLTADLTTVCRTMALRPQTFRKSSAAWRPGTVSPSFTASAQNLAQTIRSRSEALITSS